MKSNDKIGIKGKFKISKFRNGNLINETDWQDNLVVSSDTYGRNLIARAIAGDNTYPIEIDSMVLSTNNTAPTNTDTAWGGTEIDVPIQLPDVANNVVTFSAFFTDGDLPNGTYYKIGLAMNGRIFTSALLDIPEVKATGDEYRIDYQVTIN
jgi:hypothetical protein